METYGHLNMHGREVANDGGRGPEIEVEGHAVCFELVWFVLLGHARVLIISIVGPLYLSVKVETCMR